MPPMYMLQAGGEIRQEGAGRRTVTEFMTIEEVRTAYDLCRRGDLAGAAKIGNQWRVDETKLRAWLAEGGAAAVAFADDPERAAGRTPRA